MLKNQIVILAGPTGIGKTNLVGHFDKHKFEVISFDSRQIYKELDIGTAKPTLYDRKKISYHLVDLVCPSKSFTVTDYCNLAYNALRKIWSKGKIPLLTVGTPFYLRAFLFGVFESLKSSVELKSRVENLEVEQKIRILEKLDFSFLSKISKNDIYRVNRAVELLLSGLKPSTLAPKNGLLDLEGVCISGFFIDIEREKLYERINNRVVKMVEGGMIEETKFILEKYGPSCPALKAIGYNYVIDFLNLKIKKLDLINLISKSHRNYAKKQITWFRNGFESILKKLPKQEIKTQIELL